MEINYIHAPDLERVDSSVRATRSHHLSSYEDMTLSVATDIVVAWSERSRLRREGAVIARARRMISPRENWAWWISWRHTCFPEGSDITLGHSQWRPRWNNIEMRLHLWKTKQPNNQARQDIEARPCWVERTSWRWWKWEWIFIFQGILKHKYES